jgi:hypothetical protein
VLGSDKVGEGSGEKGEKIGDIQAPPTTFHKNTFKPKPNPLRNRLDTPPNAPMFPPQINVFQKHIKFKSDMGNEFFGKKGEKPSEKPQPKEKPKPKPVPFHYDHCRRVGQIKEFCFRRRREERLAREMENNNRYRPSRGVPEPHVVPSGKRVGFGCGEFTFLHSWSIRVWGE